MSEESSVHDPAAAPGKRRPILRMILAAIIGIPMLVIILQNGESVKIRLLFTSTTMPLAILLIVTFLAGFVVGRLSAYLRRRRRGK